MATKLKLGIFGFGCVGQGLHQVLSKSSGFKTDIVKICVKDRAKKRSLDASLFTFDKYEILNNPEINVVVELIDDAEEAYHIVKYALQQGKHVVTANKKLLANHLYELTELQQKHNVSLLYEASACGSIPIIRTLEEYYDNELLYSVSGIFNGTSNFILTKTIFENLSYADALKKAQDLGFAETDPTNDVEGYDAKFKSVILAAHAFGLFAKQEEVFNIGINTIAVNDIRYAKEKGKKIKLVPTIKKLDENNVAAFVVPQLINNENYLFNVENEYNGVIVEGAFSDKQFLFGKGAGGNPTGSAVLSDISALSYGYRYEYKKFKQNKDIKLNNNILIDIYLRYNTADDLNKIKFESINEKYSSGNYNYVIGRINLKQLIANRDYIQKENLFFASVGEEIGVVKAKQESVLKGQELVSVA